MRARKPLLIATVAAMGGLCLLSLVRLTHRGLAIQNVDLVAMASLSGFATLCGVALLVRARGGGER